MSVRVCPHCNGEMPVSSTIRNAEIVSLYVADDLTLSQVGEKFGLTRERVRQILTQAGVDVKAVVAERTARREAERAVNRAAERAARFADVPPCRVCGGAVLRSRAKTCSPECSDALAALRRYIEPDAYEEHRKRCARALLAHPERYSASELTFARRVVNGTAPPPNRRYIWAGSRADVYAKKFGIDLGLGTAS